MFEFAMNKTRKYINIVGEKFTRLLVLDKAENYVSPSGSVKTMFLCLCDCGNKVTVQKYKLTSGHSRSCGCLLKDINKSHGHGMSDTGAYKSWMSMRRRCLNPKREDYALYGKRNISICKRWDDFTLFYKDMGDRPNGASLDRINNDGDYCPENCRWATNKEQALNKRTTLKRKYKGKVQSVMTICEKEGKDYGFVRSRLARGWSIKDAINIPKYYNRDNQ